MGDWKAVKNSPPISDGKWHLFNITADIGENTDLGKPASRDTREVDVRL